MRGLRAGPGRRVTRSGFDLPAVLSGISDPDPAFCHKSGFGAAVPDLEGCKRGEAANVLTSGISY